MGGLRRIMMPNTLLLCYLLLHPIDAISYGTQTKALMHLTSLGSQPPSSDFSFCQVLLPKSLPGFTHMAPLPRFLVGLALKNALEKAGCQAYAWIVEHQFYRLGGVKATQLLIRHLRGLQKGRSVQGEVSVEALTSALQLLAREQPGPDRALRSLHTEDCEQEREQSVHSALHWLPAVGTFYNLGTALYYAAQNCLEKAKERGQDGAIDLGYDLLMTMAGLSGAPTGLLISAALKPAVKVGVERLIQYYYEEETKTSLPETRGSLVGTTDVSGLGWETTTMASEVSEVVSSVPCEGWGPLKIHYLDP
ncbi:apolipoprotein F isoform 2-T4 [Dugong dugon]